MQEKKMSIHSGTLFGRKKQNHNKREISESWWKALLLRMLLVHTSSPQINTMHLL